MEFLMRMLGGDQKPLPPQTETQLPLSHYREGPSMDGVVRPADNALMSVFEDVKSGAVEQFDANGDGYDDDRAAKAGLKRDKSGHMGSVAPASKDERKQFGLPEEAYVLLKGKKHETWQKALEAEYARGFKVMKLKDRYYSVPKDWSPPQFLSAQDVYEDSRRAVMETDYEGYLKQGGSRYNDFEAIRTQIGPFDLLQKMYPNGIPWEKWRKSANIEDMRDIKAIQNAHSPREIVEFLEKVESKKVAATFEERWDALYGDPEDSKMAKDAGIDDVGRDTSLMAVHRSTMKRK